ncbi:hypothetical protein NBT05_04635 [Aquimarina sp. ERC-38]|uniref:hypothetical protein n=1 Tax=Aquimarina sp. ERC-38 TaxID=2949996 RepID=UPI00224630B0|nr:hypothetical protein [Aquimarina sp. ERC-38]UZO81757.1 hypothetical protein NBT05_04635 [Aquimarina sp. ERC-38]
MRNLDAVFNIPKDVTTRDDLDFYFLREKGIEYISQLGGRLWTDYNSHDPGITILEMLSYAISDLGMRINMPIENLLASDNKGTGIETQFFKPAEIFPSKPITALDYRKLLIDIPGIKNCWLHKHEKQVFLNCKKDLLSYNTVDVADVSVDFKREFTLQGLYNITLEYDEDFLEEGIDDIPEEDQEVFINVKKEKLIEAARMAYHQNRNLCEDLVDIGEIELQDISICASIEVENEADEELIHAKILLAIDNYFSPSVPFYSIQQMLDKGYTTDQIFEGPILKKGFIDRQELENANLREEVRLSDIIKLIMDIDGVKFIKDITIGNCDDNIADANDWIICIDDGKKPALCSKSVINYNKGFLPLNINQDKVDAFIEELKPPVDQILDQSLVFPRGQYFKNEEYTTIQNDFPDTYGIGINGLSARVTTERKAKARQLKGYLLFFDQILASYFQHLGKVKELLSVSGRSSNTYFTQAIKDIADFDDLVSDYITNNDEVLTNELFKEMDNSVDRRNQILDHLLARFAERFSEYTFLMKTLYGDSTDEIVLRNKEAFLRDYKVISAERGNAFNYYKQPFSNLWNTDNISGTQKRLARLLGIKNYNRRNISDSFIMINESIDDNDSTAYRWEIKDKEGKPILRATEGYGSKAGAINELNFTVLQLIETSTFELDAAFSEPLKDDTEVSNIKLNISGKKGVYSFSVINPEIPASSTDHIIAIHSRFYDTQDKLKKGIFDTLAFIENDFTEEGLFLVEHILLRPGFQKDGVDVYPEPSKFIPICSDTCENCEPIDPYSYRVSIILPGYTFRFSDSNFRNYMENVIRQEIPAHVVARICWIGHRQSEVPDEENGLFRFEKAYKEYLEAKTNSLGEEEIKPEGENSKLEEMLDKLYSLQTLYPAGRLIDCDNDDDIEGQIILGRTSLGSL